MPEVSHNIPDGAVRIFRSRPYSEPSLVIAKWSVAHRYGAVFIQFPERGVPSGGSGWAYEESCFTEPQTVDEEVLMLQYLTAKRVIDLTAELVEAEGDVEAVRRFARLIAQQGSDG